MKCTSFFAFALAATMAITASGQDTNSARFARGLPPNPPYRRDGTLSHDAKRSQPSGTFSYCPSGARSHCCTYKGPPNDSDLTSMFQNAGITPDNDNNDDDDSNNLLGAQCRRLSGGSCPSSRPYALCCTKSYSKGSYTSGCSTCNL